MTEKTITVDFVARGELPDEWKMVLVEEGPWPGDLEDQLRRIQNRLYDCLDLILDGKVAEKFPQSNEGHLVIQIDFYNVKKDEISDFLLRFEQGIQSSTDYGPAIRERRYAKTITFKFNFDRIH